MSKETAIIYVRVSTKGQETDGESIPLQIKNCTDYADKQGFEKPKVFKETYSGMKPGKRPQFMAMLRYLKENKPRHLIFLRPDR